MVTLATLVPPHCHARPGQCASYMGLSLKKVNFGHTGSELAKSAARRRDRLALYPCILQSPYYNTVKELPHLNQFRESYGSRSAKSKIQKRSRPRRVKCLIIPSSVIKCMDDASRRQRRYLSVKTLVLQLWIALSPRGFRGTTRDNPV